MSIKHFILFLFFFPTCAFAQSNEVATLDSSLENEWIILGSGWKYHSGDNMDWANPALDDSSWPVLFSFNLKIPDSLKVSGDNDIGWFRKRIKLDKSLNQQLVMRIFQTGASEIYLDGELIQTLGTVSTDPNEFEYYSPSQDLLSFPIKPQTEQTLAVRYLNSPSHFPIYSVYEGMALRVSTLNHANYNPPLLQFKIRYYFVLGVAVFMIILFLAYFIFLPTERINLYFAISSIFFALFIVAVLYSLNTHGRTFWAEFCVGIFISIQMLLVLFCIYKIFKKNFGIIFWSYLAIGVLHIPLLFLFDYEIVSPLLGILVLLETFRISMRSLKTDRSGALIFIVFGILNILFWIGIILNQLAVLNLPTLWLYQPFAFLLMPLSLAIYLGYSYGIRSESLRKNLVEVEVLSAEKQEILAQQNVVLERQVAERTATLSESLENLKAAQSQLIQSEKMASLGELTAGIAHEIQNPLNFVNNFSEVSKELLVEMKEEIDGGNTQDAKEIADDVIQNLEKIAHHGKRADSIVKGMLQHSRTSTGIKEPIDINALCDEYLRLSYHGLRAKDKSFNANLVTNFDPTIGKITVIAQDIGRVILNLLTNAFYACAERSSLANASGDKNYEPTVSISTIINSSSYTTDKTGTTESNAQDGNSITISIKDNGNGIPKRILDKIFQPFFTTKPTGEGTGLGLSLSYDIIKAHGGELKVETEDGVGTTFNINLPK